MTDSDFFLIAGYLASSARNTVIEVEIPAKDQVRFEADYARRTGGFPLPTLTSAAPYYVWATGTNKWGIECRAYFLSNASMPTVLDALLEPNKIQNRPGYNNWQRRISHKDPIYRLFEHGFVVGSPQDHIRIRATVPAAYLADFDTGFRL